MGLFKDAGITLHYCASVFATPRPTSASLDVIDQAGNRTEPPEEEIGNSAQTKQFVPEIHGTNSSLSQVHISSSVPQCERVLPKGIPTINTLGARH